MSFKTLTIKESTYRKIAKWKGPGESFSDVLEREFDRKIETAADLLELARSRKGKGLGIAQVRSRRTSRT